MDERKEDEVIGREAEKTGNKQMKQVPVGATHIGDENLSPRIVVEMSTSVTSRRTLGRNLSR